MNKLTFKQYLDSKAQLIKAIGNTPVSIQEYEVHNYCSLTVGEDEDEKLVVSLKPKNRVIVEWRYDTITCPVPVSVKVLGVSDIDESEAFNTYWTSIKLKKWLSNHTRELQSSQHTI